MVDKKIIVVGLGFLMAFGTIGFNWVEMILPSAEAHGVQAQLQSRFIRIEDESFNRQSLQTGETNMPFRPACEFGRKKPPWMDFNLLRINKCR